MALSNLVGVSRNHSETRFSVFSSVAEGMVLILFPGGEEEKHPMVLEEGNFWVITLTDVAVGTEYGYRVIGDFDPANGVRCNPAKLLLDPYALGISGNVDWKPEFETSVEVEGEDEKVVVEKSQKDSGAVAPRGVVIDHEFDWGDDVSPKISWEDTVVYELHVKGFTKQMQEVPEKLRGTYAGLANDSAVGYLRDLGVTAVQLLPVHAHLNDEFLVEKGLTNYWGYNTIGFFAPHPEWASHGDAQGCVNEVKGMVKALHRAGMEVILDVVYNHTGEGGPTGPTISMRGFEDRAYYKSSPKNPESYWDCTGCGNTVDLDHPRALRLVMDSLRYWVEEYHVDGFRFDLAATLGRREMSFDQASAFFTSIDQDPVLSKVKLIAEPWDVGQADSYQVGAFPWPWREINGKFRDTARQFWRGDGGQAGALAGGLCGSQRTFDHSGRSATTSVNFVTCHDGFTLKDLVSYSHKDNEANGEGNRDGSDNNDSWDCGGAPDTDDEHVLATRGRLQRSLLMTTILSSGVPFLNAGDEIGRTQRGNNNAYCQDSPISWIDWSEGAVDKDLLAFTRMVLQLRREISPVNRDVFYSGDRSQITGVLDVRWFLPSGKQMTHELWYDEGTRAFMGVFAKDEDTAFLLMLNGSRLGTEFVLPGLRRNRWDLFLDTAIPTGVPTDSKKDSPKQGGDSVELMGTSARLYQLTAGGAVSAERRPTKVG